MSKRKRTAKPAFKSVATPPASELTGMLALSCRQPWATFIVTGEKTIEYRSQPTALRQRILVYASLGRRTAEWEADIANECGMDLAELEAMPRGVIVGSVELCDCTDNGYGEFEWHLADPVRFEDLIKPRHRPNPVWFRPFG